MRSFASLRMTIIVPVASMLAIQVMISLSVLSLGVMMPVVARDLAIDAKLVGVFTALIYAVATITSLAAAGPIVRLGAVRVCQAALLMAAAGLALNSLALVAATVGAVLFIGALLGWVGWQGASLVAAGLMVIAAVLVEPLRSRLDVITVANTARPSIWRSVRFVLRHPQLRVLGCSAFVFVVAQHTFTFYLVTYLYEHCGLSIARAGFLLFLSQIAGAGVRLVSGGMGDRMPRMKLLGWTGLGMAVGSTATGLIGADTPFWLIALVVMGYGSVVISWNGTSQAEFAHLSPPGETAAIAAVQNALAFSGAVFGPPIFAAIASAASYRAAFLAVAVCVLLSGIWQLVAARRA